MKSKDTLRVAFVTPSDKLRYKPFRQQPLVALYLLTILEEHFGQRLRLSLIDLRGIQEDAIFYHIPENDIFLYSVTSPYIDEFSKIVVQLRTIYPDALHIAGGPHINIFPEYSKTIFDTIVLGEGEGSIIEIVHDIFNSGLKPVYKQRKPVNLDLYPYPSREYLPKTVIVSDGVLRGEYLNLKATDIIFSRGCPFNCNFCANNKLTFGPVRYRSPKLLKDEIEELKREYQIEALAFKDDNCISLNPVIARACLEVIGQTGLKWKGQSRANGVPEEIVILAKDAGCTDLHIGIESVFPEVLKISNKKLDLDEAKNFIRLLNKVGIGPRIHLMVGLPGEPENLVEKTIEFIDEVSPASVLLSLLCPYPGCEIYEHPEKFGVAIRKNVEWEKFQTLFGRFDATELPFVVFEYNEVAPWGKGMSVDRILHNYIELQTILRERGLNF